MLQILLLGAPSSLKGRQYDVVWKIIYLVYVLSFIGLCNICLNILNDWFFSLRKSLKFFVIYYAFQTMKKNS